MKNKIILFLISILGATVAFGQCSVCTKSVQQLGEGPASGLNTGILYLAFTPMLILGVIGYTWWKRNGSQEEKN